MGRTPTVGTKYGRKQLKLSEEEVGYLYMTLFIQSLQAMGMTDAEIARSVTAGKRDIVRGKTKKDKKPSSSDIDVDVDLSDIDLTLD